MQCFEYMVAVNFLAEEERLGVELTKSRMKQLSTRLSLSSFPAPPVLNPCTVAGLAPKSFHRPNSQTRRSAEIERLAAACRPVYVSGRPVKKVKRVKRAKGIRPPALERMESMDLPIPAPLGEKASSASVDLPLPAMLGEKDSAGAMDLPVPAMMSEEPVLVSVELPMPDMLGQEPPAASIGLSLPAMIGQMPSTASVDLPVPAMMNAESVLASIDLPMPAMLGNEPVSASIDLPLPAMLGHEASPVSVDLPLPAMMGDESVEASMDLPMPAPLDAHLASSSSTALPLPPTMSREYCVGSPVLSLPPLSAEGIEDLYITLPLPPPFSEETYKPKPFVICPPMKAPTPVPAHLKRRRRVCVRQRFPKRIRAMKSIASYIPEEGDWARWSVRELSIEDGCDVGSGYGGDEDDEDALERQETTFDLSSIMSLSSSATRSSATNMRNCAVAILWC